MALSKEKERLALLGLTERDATLLRSLRPVIEQHQESLAEACCEQMETLPETAEILHARAGRPRLNDIFRQYLRRCQTGHLPIPLAQTWFLAGTIADHTVSGMNEGPTL